MRVNEQLFPDRPGREELFHIAERWLDRGRVVEPVEPAAPSVVFSSPMMAPMALGFLLEKPLSRLLDERSSARRQRHEDAVLSAELHCRDLEPFESIGKMVAHIVANERPSGR